MEIQSTKQHIDHPSQPAGADLSEGDTVPDRYILHDFMLRLFHINNKTFTMCDVWGSTWQNDIFHSHSEWN